MILHQAFDMLPLRSRVTAVTDATGQCLTGLTKKAIAYWNILPDTDMNRNPDPDEASLSGLKR
jgi:hypothetical protein